MVMKTISTLPSSQTNQQANCLRISEADFNKFYPDLVGLYDRFNNPPLAGISSQEFEAKYLSSKLWRLNNVYNIVDKNGDKVTFRMNYAQHKVYAASRLHPRLIVLKSRQQGISTLWLVSYFDDATFCDNLNLGLMAQGTDEAATLLERTKFLWDTLDPDIKAFTNVKLLKDNTKEFSFSNNSSIFIRVSFRSATLQRLHISEFGKIANQYPKRARETKTGSLQALGRGNTGIIESTAEGINMFKTMWDQAVVVDSSDSLSQKDFKPVFLSWVEDPDCWEVVDQPIDTYAQEYFDKVEKELGITLAKEQKNFWIVQYRELGEDVHQEYPATPAEAFSASKNGSYYSTIFTKNVVERKRLVKNLYDPQLPVDIYFDIGIDDYMVMLFVQIWDDEIRIIDEYWNEGYGFKHYIDEAFDREYTFRAIKFPHDIEQRETTAINSRGLARTRMDVVTELIDERARLDGISSPLVERLDKSSIADGIEAVRRMIPKIKVDPKCEYIVDCFHKYSKEWDDKLSVWKQTPRHDEFSHGADTLRGLATDIGLSNMESEAEKELKRYQNYRRRQSQGFAV